MKITVDEIVAVAMTRMNYADAIYGPATPLPDLPPIKYVGKIDEIPYRRHYGPNQLAKRQAKTKAKYGVK